MEQILSTPTTPTAEATPPKIETPHTETDIQKLIALVAALDFKVTTLLENSEKMKRRATQSMWLTIIFVVLPIALSLIALPILMKTFFGSMGLGDGIGTDIGGMLQEIQKSQQE